MIKLLQKRREFLCAQIADCHRLIDAAPPGKLEIYANRANTKWYIKPDNGERIYLPKSERETATLLAQKRLSLSRLKILEKELFSINLLLKHYPTDKDYLSLATESQRFADILINAPGTPWHLTPYKKNASFPENLKHPSPSGHILRSKSECLIDMELFYRRIPFRYDAEITLNGNNVCPDFMFCNDKTGEIKYWEHFGMMDDLKYRKRAFEKMDLYLDCGLIPGENIIITYETSNSPITIHAIDKIIDDLESWLSQ